jgi:hypothetical protein
MSDSGPTPTTDIPSPRNPDASSVPGQRSPAQALSGKSVSVTVLAGAVAGLVSWLVGEVVVNAFLPPLQTIQMMGQTIKKANFEDQSAADFKNATLAFAVLGGALGSALGAAGGLTRRSGRGAITGAAVGLVLGSLIGTLSSLVFLPVYFRALDRSQEEIGRDIVLPLVVHGGIWASCGLAAGIAFAVGLGGGRDRILKAGLGGLIGAALGAALYEMIAAAAFPNDKSTSPLSITWQTRLLARLLVAALAAALAAIVTNMNSHQGAGPGKPS